MEWFKKLFCSHSWEQVYSERRTKVRQCTKCKNLQLTVFLRDAWISTSWEELIKIEDDSLRYVRTIYDSKQFPELVNEHLKKFPKEAQELSDFYSMVE